MAGIGFKLRRITEDETVGGFLRAYVSAGFICAGPWIFTVAALAVAMLAGRRMGVAVDTFQSLIAYAYAFSLVLTAPLQNIVTRYLADRLYARDTAQHLPTLVGVLVVNTPFQALVATGLLTFLDVPIPFKMVTVVLYVTISTTWVSMAFLGVIRAYAAIVQAFLVGSAVSLAAILALLPLLGEWAALLAYSGGQGLTLLLMLGVLFREFDLRKKPDFAFLAYFARYPDLAWSSLLMVLGIWIANVVTRLSPQAAVSGHLPNGPLLDLAIFVGLLTVIPAITMFFVRIETDFYEAYRRFYGGITDGRICLAALIRQKQGMRDSLTRGLTEIVQVQGCITLGAIFLAPVLVAPLDLVPAQVAVVRVCCAGAFFFVICQFEMTIMYYYEAYRAALWTALTLTGISGAVTWLAPSFLPLGGGLVAGALAGCLLGAALLARLLRHLEYETFQQQPMPGETRQVAGQACQQTVYKKGTWMVPPEPEPAPAVTPAVEGK